MTIKDHRDTISIILPCRNEGDAIQVCLDNVYETISDSMLDVEIIVVDNNSTDNSKLVAESNVSRFTNMRIVSESTIGYGAAYQKGFNVSTGEYIFMADADGTYDFRYIPIFLNKLKEGYDFVIGNRFAVPLPTESMSILHRVGNLLLSFTTRVFFGLEITDIHCGERMITRKALHSISPTTLGMEFASEMIVKAKSSRLKMTEISITYKPRLGKSKLRTFRDGLRHILFLSKHSKPLLLLLLAFFTSIILMLLYYIY